MQAIDAVRAGTNPEDDRIEFKREWPGPEKARQLAATANQARGDHIIYVMGIDDKTGAVHPLDSTDPADWWAQIESRFDEVAPDLERHLGVQISGEERVVALLFRTDRAPYVVKVGKDGGGELEVPIRAGTRTRSAKRHELIRMLYPAITVPQLTPLSAQLTLTPPQPSAISPRDYVSFDLMAQVYFEHVATTPTFLPWHGVRFSIAGGGFEAAGKHRRYVPQGAAPTNAVHVRHDGIRVSESGAAPVQARWALAAEHLKALQLVSFWVVEIEFEAAGTSRRPTVSIPLEGPLPRTYIHPDGRIETDGDVDWNLQAQR